MQFPERWHIRPPRTAVVDDVTGNAIPGPPPDPILVMGSLEQRFPRQEQREVGSTIVDENLLLLHPSAQSLVPGGITKNHKAIGPDGVVWSIVRLPRERRRRRPNAPIRYLALVIRRATDIKES